VESIPALIEKKNLEVFDKHGVLTPVEVHSRYEISLEGYVKTIRIEALTMIEMVNRQILPASMRYVKQMADTVASLNAAGADASSAKAALDKLTAITSSLRANTEALTEEVDKLDAEAGDSLEHAKAYKEKVIALMQDVRVDADKLEAQVDAELWPLPTYGDLLFKV